MGADLFDSFTNEKLRLTPGEVVLRFGDPTLSFCFVSERPHNDTLLNDLLSG